MARKYSKHGPRDWEREEEEDEAPAPAVPCWLCSRPLGKTVIQHHPVPKSRGGRDVVPMHPICQQALIANFTNSELQRHGMDVEGPACAPQRAQVRRLGGEEGPRLQREHEEAALTGRATTSQRTLRNCLAGYAALCVEITRRLPSSPRTRQVSSGSRVCAPCRGRRSKHKIWRPGLRCAHAVHTTGAQRIPRSRGSCVLQSRDRNHPRRDLALQG